MLMMAFLWITPYHQTFAESSADQEFAVDHLTVITATGHHDFTVEIADIYSKRKQGLMHRKSLPLDHGMIFVFPTERPLSFWMKDTPLSLDLIFFDHQGHYVSHQSNAIPGSLTSIKSGAPAQFVLEINAGLVEKLRIGEGTHFQRNAKQ